MIDIPLFKEQVESKLKATGHDMDWLAKQTNTNRQVLAMVLGRKSMKNSTPLLSDICDLLKLDIPRTDDNLKTDRVEPVEGQKDTKGTKGYKEEKPTLIDDMSEPLAEINEPVFWIDGQPYTKAYVTRMIEDSVADHRKINELIEDRNKVMEELETAKKELEGYPKEYEELSDKYEILEHDYQTKTNQHLTALAEIDKLNKELQELTDKYMAKDKECMKYGIMVNDLHAEIDELKDAEPIELESLTIAQAIQHYRALKRLFTDEVLQ